MKAIVAYFSRAHENYFGGSYRYIEKGNTEYCAEFACRHLGCDIYRIEMKDPYSPEYRTCIEQAKRDLHENSRPKLASEVPTADGYDTLILCYPNYWGTVPMAVYSFLDSFPTEGMKILPLCTNEGSGMGTSVDDLRRYCPGAKVLRGLPICGSDAKSSENDVDSWLDSQL